MELENINRYIDHTMLKADADYGDIYKLCEEAVKYNFYSVCVNPYYVCLAKSLLSRSDVKVTTVVGFPLGMNLSEVKYYEAKEAINDGADEIDMVMNINAFKSEDYDMVYKEISQMKNLVGDEIILKVIIETCLLTKDEIIEATDICVDAKADFVKTSTGFSTGGALIEDIKLIKENFHDKIKIKASGGISDYGFCKELILAGADRIGASKSVKIMNEINK